MPPGNRGRRGRVAHQDERRRASRWSGRSSPMGNRGGWQSRRIARPSGEQVALSGPVRDAHRWIRPRRRTQQNAPPRKRSTRWPATADFCSCSSPGVGRSPFGGQQRRHRPAHNAAARRLPVSREHRSSVDDLACVEAVVAPDVTTELSDTYLCTALARSTQPAAPLSQLDHETDV
jgi:hypothetical protein